MASRLSCASGQRNICVGVFVVEYQVLVVLPHAAAEGTCPNCCPMAPGGELRFTFSGSRAVHRIRGIFHWHFRGVWTRAGR